MDGIGTGAADLRERLQAALGAAYARELGGGGCVVIMLVTSLASWIFSSDVTIVSVIVARAPALAQEDLQPSHLAIGLVRVLNWAAGNVLFGPSVVRAKVCSRWAGERWFGHALLRALSSRPAWAGSREVAGSLVSGFVSARGRRDATPSSSEP
jgi:hypothetical protein